MYSKKAKQLKAMIRAKPVKPEQLLVRWTEFAAEFGMLENLQPFGTRLGFVQYYQIDVVLFLVLIAAAVLWLLVKLILLPVRLAIRRLGRESKLKTQ